MNANRQRGAELIKRRSWWSGSPGRCWRQRFKNNLIYWGVRAALALLVRLPERLIRTSGPAIGRAAHRLARLERRRALTNVMLSDLSLPAAARPGLVRNSFRVLGCSAAETLLLARGGGEWIERRLADGELSFAPGAEVCLERMLSRGHGVVFASAHYGNWELLGALVARFVPMLCVLARPSYDQRFTALIDGMRSGLGVRSLWVGPGQTRSALRGAIEALRTGAVVGVLLDQPVRGDAEMVSFFGRPAPTSTAAARLARIAGASLMVGMMQRTPEGGWQATLAEVDPTPEASGGREAERQLTASLTAEIEHHIRRDPEPWLWTLDRWRMAPGRSELGNS